MAMGQGQDMTATASQMTLRIVGHDLPGLRWACYEHIHVGTQRGREPVDLVPGDAERAVFTLPVRVVEADDGSRDFRGPWVQGRRGERFVYLTWGQVPEDGGFAMFRRAKLWLADIPGELVREAAGGSAVLETRLGLTAADGGPRCASIRPPEVRWTAVEAV